MSECTTSFARSALKSSSPDRVFQQGNDQLFKICADGVSVLTGAARVFCLLSSESGLARKLLYCRRSLINTKGHWQWNGKRKNSQDT